MIIYVYLHINNILCIRMIISISESISECAGMGDCSAGERLVAAKWHHFNFQCWVFGMAGTPYLVGG